MYEKVIYMDRETKQKFITEIEKIRKIIEERKLQEQAESDDLYEKFYEPEEGEPNEDVYYENFVWNRKKSNDNIKDTGDGKGFSFYYAAQVWKDDDHYTIKDKNNKEHPDNNITLGLVTTENIVVVVNAELENGKIRIISAWEDVNEGHYTETYIKHKENNRKYGKNKGKREDSSTYLLIRRANNKRFFSNSKGKIIEIDELDFPFEGNFASYKGKKVFVQKVGTFEDCKKIQNIIDAYLKHSKNGFDW